MNYVENLRQKIGHDTIILNGSAVIFENERGEILLQHRNEKRKRWGLPGGLMELGESTKETACREVLEETGWKIAPEDLTLLDVYSGENYYVEAENGDTFYVVSTAYYTRKISTTYPHVDKESLQWQWFSEGNLPENIANTYQKMLQDYFKKA